MIAKLKGIVDSLGEDHLILDVNGVGYLVQASTRTLGRLTLGEAVQLHIETVVREDSFSLFGFADLEERDWFKLLQSVQGVGARVALAILAVLPPQRLSLALATQDKAAVTQASGVGPKLAARIVAELKDKAAKMTPTKVQLRPQEKVGANPAAPEQSVPIGPSEDAVSALENLGYGRSEAFSAVATALNQLGEDANVSALISASLKSLARPS